MYHLWYMAYKRDFVIVMIYVTCVYQYNVLPSFPGCHVGKSTRGVMRYSTNQPFDWNNYTSNIYHKQERIKDWKEGTHFLVPTNNFNWKKAVLNGKITNIIYYAWRQRSSHF